MAIGIIQHTATITKKVIAAIKEDRVVRSGFGGFFPAETVPTRQVSISVQRGSSLIATDVYVFGGKNMGKNSKATEKIYVPPVFRQGYNFSQEEVYDTTIGMGMIPNGKASGMMAQKAVDGLRIEKNKIERAIQKQHSDVLQTGIITLKNGDNIDFGRKAISMPDLGVGNYWNEAGVDPRTSLQAGGKFLREVGLSSSTTFNAVLGGDAFSAFMNSDKIDRDSTFTTAKRMDILSPKFDEVTGMTFQGQIATNDYLMNIWTYSEYYQETVGGPVVYYLDPKAVVMLPEDFRGKTVHGALPAMNKDSIPYAIEADFYVRAYTDVEAMAKMFEVAAAPVAIPFDIDKIYSPKVLA